MSDSEEKNGGTPLASNVAEPDDEQTAAAVDEQDSEQPTEQTIEPTLEPEDMADDVLVEVADLEAPIVQEIVDPADQAPADVRDLPDELPILPLRGMVIYPHTTLPLTVGQPRSVK